MLFLTDSEDIVCIYYIMHMENFKHLLICGYLIKEAFHDILSCEKTAEEGGKIEKSR